MPNNISKSEIDEMTSIKGIGISILRIPLGDLIPLFREKGKQFDWLMDVLEHPGKHEQALQEYRQHAHRRSGYPRVCENPERLCCPLLRRP